MRMIGAAGLLTLVTLTGLISGLAREWLLVSSWGAGARTDAFLVAIFIPEAVRIILGGGLLASATMSLWQGCEKADRPLWLGRMSAIVGVVALGLSLILSLGAPLWSRLVGPGLNADHLAVARSVLQWLAWGLPGMALQALWSVPLQARGRYVLAGMGSLLYNLPAVVYLAWFRSLADERVLAMCFVGGALASCLALLPSMWRLGWRPALTRWHTDQARSLGKRVMPLLGGAMVGHLLMMLERIVASYLGEGVVTVLNLARKLINLPLMAMMSINQVLLGLMSKGAHTEQLRLLRQGMALVTVVSTTGAMGIMLASPALVSVLFPRVQGTAVMASVLAWYAVTLVVTSWNSLLTRFSHARGNTRVPFECELAAGAAQAVALLTLSPIFGVTGMACAALISVIVQGTLLWRRGEVWGHVPMTKPVLISGALLGVAGAWIAPNLPQAPWWQLAWASGVSLMGMGLLAATLQPWRTPAA
jgi:murein biosynthesis integral membrane protein MurJ